MLMAASQHRNHSMIVVIAVLKVLPYYFPAFLVWLFTLLILIPLSHEVVTEVPLHSLVAFIAFIAITHQVFNASIRLLEALRLETSRRNRLIILEGILMLDAVLLIPIVWAASPILGGIGLMFVLLCAGIILLLYLDVVASLTIRDQRKDFTESSNQG